MSYQPALPMTKAQEARYDELLNSYDLSAEEEEEYKELNYLFLGE